MTSSVPPPGSPIQPTISGVLRSASIRLEAAGLETSRLDAEVLLRHALHLTRTELFLRYPDPIDEDDQQHFEDLVRRRLAGEPVAYLVGTREFMGLPFDVAPGVLIPRPETELLVEWALETMVSLEYPTVVDIGTGSGAISVSVAALARRPVRVIATDVSAQALGIARTNADNILDPEQRGRIRFTSGSLLEPISRKVNLVLANLPYLTPEQISGNPDLDAEPELALHGGDDGLDLVRELVADLPRVLVPGGGVGLELDPSQTATVEGLLGDLFPGRRIHTIRDLAGLNRHVVMEPLPGADSVRGGSHVA